MKTTLDEYASRMSEIPGAFSRVNLRVCQAIAEEQASRGVTGNLFEIGTYLGRSAVVLGAIRKDGEEVHLCEPFHSPSADSPDFLPHTLDWYDTYTLENLKSNYARFHDDPPVIHAMESTDLVGKLPNDSFRFLHLDGSHHRPTLTSDVEMAKALATRDAVVAFSAFRSAHTLEVAARVWAEVHEGSFHPIAATESHLYAALEPYGAERLAAVRARLEEFPEIQVIPSRFGEEEVALVRGVEHETRLKQLVPPVLLPFARKLRSAVGRSTNHSQQ